MYADQRLANPRLLRLAAERRRLRQTLVGPTDATDACLAHSLLAYTQAAWPLIEPSTPLIASWHLGAIAEHLEAVTAGEIRNLLITVPPRSGKSSMVSVMWPTWSWITKPETRWLYASYAQALSTRDALRSRRVIQSAWYQQRWGDRFRLSEDQNLKTRYDNNRSGYRLATSVGGSATGEGGSVIVCLPYETEVQTTSGPKPIGWVVETRAKDAVLCYNHVTAQAEYQAIDAWECAPGRPMMRLITDQTALTCTSDHPVYVVGRGYVQAQAIQPGDEILWHDVHLPVVSAAIQRSSVACTETLFPSLSRGSPHARQSRAEYLPVSAVQHNLLSDAYPCDQGQNGHTGGDLLQSDLLWPLGTRGEQSCLGWGQSQNTLSGLLEGYVAQAVTTGYPSDLQQEMSSEASNYPSPWSPAHGRLDPMPSVWHLDLDQTILRAHHELLFGRVQRSGAQRTDAGARQWPIRPWRGDATLRAQFQQSAQRSGAPARWLSVPSLRRVPECVREAPRCSSCELRQRRYASGQSGQPLSILPWSDAWECAPAGRVVPLVVQRIERLPESPAVVYNIRTGLHNYFAAGLLVHNCDDAHNLLEIHSETIREGVLTWWDEVMASRLNDPKTGARVIVQQRGHERDLAGHVLAQGGYVHLCYDAETEVLARSGWIKFAELRHDEEVMGVDPATLEGAWQLPTRYLDMTYEGDVFHYSSDVMDLMVTPDHRMVFKDYNDWKTDKRLHWRIAPAHRLPQHFYLPQAIVWEGESEPIMYAGRTWLPHVFAEFMGWYLAEGCANAKRCSTRVVQKDGPKADELAEVLAQIPFSVKRSRHGRDGLSVWYIGSKDLAAALAPLGTSHHKCVPEEIKNLAPPYLEQFLIAFAKGDGHFAVRNIQKISVSSRSERLIDDLQECAVKAGWASSKSHAVITSGSMFNGYLRPAGICWKLYIRTSKAPERPRKWYAKVRSANVFRKPYKGHVYCLSVPSTALVVRRHGRVSISGNCLPMEYEPTTYSFHGHVVDPRTTPGELLCPERIGPAEVADLKVRLGLTAFAGQYQQRPAPTGGTIFKRWWWRYWQPVGANLPPVMVQVPDGDLLAIHPVDLPETFDACLQSWDLSFKGLKDSDFVAGQVWGTRGPDRFLLDRDHRRLDFVQTQQAIRDMSAKWPEAVAKLVEDTANGPAIIASLRHSLPGLIAVRPDGDKQARAYAVTPVFEAGNVYVPHPQIYPWVDAFLHEHDVFPAGTHDDDVDANTQAQQRWMARRRFRPVGE